LGLKKFLIENSTLKKNHLNEISKKVTSVIIAHFARFWKDKVIVFIVWIIFLEVRQLILLITNKYNKIDFKFQIYYFFQKMKFKSLKNDINNNIDENNICLNIIQLFLKWNYNKVRFLYNIY